MRQATLVSQQRSWCFSATPTSGSIFLQQEQCWHEVSAFLLGCLKQGAIAVRAPGMRCYTAWILTVTTLYREAVFVSDIFWARFTADVAATFKGIIQAIRELAPAIKAANVRIFVRRGGPNYQQGLAAMKTMGQELGLPVEVYGPESSMTGICAAAIEYVKGFDK